MAYRVRIKDNQSAAVKFVEWKKRKYDIVLFTKSYSPEGHLCHAWLRACCGDRRDNYDRVFYEKRGDVAEMDTYLWTLSGENNREGQHVFVRGDYLGGYKTLLKLMRSGKLKRIVDNLANFPPGASNYLSINKSWNLAHEADPAILPDLVLKVFSPDNFTGTSVKVVRCDPSASRVDCNRYVRKGHLKKRVYSSTSAAGHVEASDSSESSLGLDIAASAEDLLDRQDSDTAFADRCIRMLRIKSRTFSRAEMPGGKEQAETAEALAESGKSDTAKGKTTSIKFKKKSSRTSTLSRSSHHEDKFFVQLQKAPKH